ncbi:MAG: TIGR03960 family B12-binding radical SAM protein [candidate division WOR-3 bacterium]
MLDEILPLVKRPVRYTGGELNITIKNNPTVYIGIVFPEVYEIGMSNLGIKIIYHMFNQYPSIQCERIFAPWPDFGDWLKQHNQSLYSLETKKPIHTFDLLGFSLQSELNYTNVLYVLDIAQIPYKSTDRDHNYPILIAGGPCTLNPLPMSPVFDAFVIGDGENVVKKISEILINIPKEKKNQRIKALADIEGIWVPQIHKKEKRIKKIVVNELAEESIPSPAILPICDITHDRLAIEVMRGCTYGCRFCQAGYTNRPLRIRPESAIIKAVDKGIRETGWEEVSLLSFSILDYPNLSNLIRKLNELLKKKNISVSLPAMRGELFTEEIAYLLKEIKKTGLTFAPEAGSERLRTKINKPFSEEHLMNAVRIAYEQGWRQVKLYFMVGLPFEEEEDVNEIKRLVNEILKMCPKGNIKISLSAFVPKPHTPFESVPFLSITELNERIGIVKRLKKNRIDLNYQAPEVSFIEALLSRADEKLFPVIEEVYNNGARFEEWREFFNFDQWKNALEKIGIDPTKYLNGGENHPWDFIDIGVKKEFLQSEYERAQKGEVTPNCYYENCSNCGACNGNIVKFSQNEEKYLSYGRYPKRMLQPIVYRVKYSIGEDFRYASHLDITRTIYRALRRTDLPLSFTSGFSPIPRVSFGPPKNVGQISKSDYFDFYLEGEYFGNISRELNTRFPPGIRILDVRGIPPNTPSLSSSINLIYYEVSILFGEIRKPLGNFKNQPVYISSKSKVKNISESIESISYNENILTCGLYYGEKYVNIYELLSYLTDLPIEEVKKYKVTRTLMFIKKGGLLYSPMEVK